MATRRKNLTIEDITYFAGLFDGEGWITIMATLDPEKLMKWYQRKTPQLALTVGVANNYKPVLEELAKKFGGKVYRVRERQHNWRIFTKQAEIFLKLIQPYVRIKSEQIKIAFEFRETFRNYKTQNDSIGISEEVIAKRLQCRNQIMKLNSPAETN
jgi:hypothetical protein